MRLLCGLIAFSCLLARVRLEEKLKLPACAKKCARVRYGRLRQRKTKVRFAAIFLLLNLCCAEAVAVERALWALPEANESATDDAGDLPPFSPYEEGYRREGDISRSEGFGGGLQELGNFDSQGEHVPAECDDNHQSPGCLRHRQAPVPPWRNGRANSSRPRFEAVLDETAVSGDCLMLNTTRFQGGQKRERASLCCDAYGDNTATPDDCCTVSPEANESFWISTAVQWPWPTFRSWCHHLSGRGIGLIPTGPLEKGENTATPCGEQLLYEDEYKQDIRSCHSAGEAEDSVSSMQGLSPFEPRQPFAVASERGRPLLEVLRLARRTFTEVRMTQGRDVAYMSGDYPLVTAIRSYGGPKRDLFPFCCYGDNTATPGNCCIMYAEAGTLICFPATVPWLPPTPSVRHHPLVDSGKRRLAANILEKGESTATPDERQKNKFLLSIKKDSQFLSDGNHKADAENHHPDREDRDSASLMQGLSPLEPRQPFAVASERGRPLLDVLMLARRTFTEVWMSHKRDVAYIRFRPIEPGLWEKKVLGWKFLAYDQPFGIPFCVHLRRTGLWASQLISPFEDEGFLEIRFITVTPQPLMLCVAGSCKTLHDTAVLAVVQDVYSSDRLLLVVEHAIQGTLEVGSLQCPIACTPTTICLELGFEERCRGTCTAQIYFRLEQTERIFTDEERIGMPAGPFVRFSLRCLDVCADDLPPQRPVREHETLIVAHGHPEQNLPELAPTAFTDDSLSMMQLGWLTDMAADESEYLEEARALVDRGDAGFTWPYPEMIKIDSVTGVPDHLRPFLAATYSFKSLKLFTTHVWHVQNSVTAYARISVMRQEGSFIEALRRDWSDLEDAFPLWGALASPQPLPLNLRVTPINMILLTDKQRRNGDRIYLVDILFMQLPRRVALLYRTRETLEDLVARAGLFEVCRAPMQRCVLVREAEEGNYHSELHQVVDQGHATTFRLEVRRSPLQDVCEQETDRVSNGTDFVPTRLS